MLKRMVMDLAEFPISRPIAEHLPIEVRAKRDWMVLVEDSFGGQCASHGSIRSLLEATSCQC